MGEEVPPGDDGLAEREFQFHLEEFKQLKEEISRTYATSYQVAVLSLTSNAAIAAFIFGSDAIRTNPVLKYMLVAVMIAMVGVLAAFSRRRQFSIDRIGAYLEKLEGVLAAKDRGLGWERYRAENNKGWLSTRRILRITFVGQLVLIAVFALVDGIVHASSAPPTMFHGERSAR